MVSYFSNIVMFLLKDIEEKAPLLQQQRKDYEGALITIDKLTLKLEDAMKVRAGPKKIHTCGSGLIS